MSWLSIFSATTSSPRRCATARVSGLVAITDGQEHPRDDRAVDSPQEVGLILAASRPRCSTPSSTRA